MTCTHPHKSTYRVRFTFVFSQAHNNHALFSSRKSYYIPKKEQYKPNSLTIKSRLENITKISYIKKKKEKTQERKATQRINKSTEKEGMKRREKQGVKEREKKKEKETEQHYC